MKNLTVYKAQGVPKDEPVESVTISLSVPFPEFDSLDTSKIVHEKGADELAEVLINTLPGGTLSRLTVKLLAHYAGLLSVPAI